MNFIITRLLLTLLGLVVERLSGLPLDEYIDTNILKPLQMNDTFFEVPSTKRDRFVQNHFINPETRSLINADYAPLPMVTGRVLRSLIISMCL